MTSPNEAALGPDGVAAMADVQDFVSADGAVLVLQRADRSSGDLVLDLELDLSGVECLDCVLPSDILADIVTDRLRERLGARLTVRLQDSRNNSEPAGPRTEEEP